MKRSIILVLDSLGLGSTEDSHLYGDTGADTLGHIIESCDSDSANNSERNGPLVIPNLIRWGLGEAAIASRKKPLPISRVEPQGAFGYAKEVSAGKDTPSGHWEICGLPVPFEWGTFPKTENCFPESLLLSLIKEGKIDGTLANKHASGTQVIEEFGQEHIDSGFPICYTSADSVFQIAAHEEHFGLDRLYELCTVAKRLVDPLEITRVIARPFTGNSKDGFERTANRKDLTTPPNGPTLLDNIQDGGGDVISVGKIGDIFSNQGVSYTVKAANNMGLVDQLLSEMKKVNEGLIFVNLVDFDTKFGHRRDVAGYALALEQFDARIPEIESQLTSNDLVLITADHGCDPTWPGNDHTREHVPVVFYGQSIKNNNLGERESFCDMGQTIAQHLEIEPLLHGKACNLS
ncbi:MAG: phosphopentomutase [Candidatus Thioglobus sp.]|jgi:phosphopentomutase|nr:phosphopentomutase [Candidatus Pseudothioglobus aerophilus]MBT8009371.1 phosphopentomutase [Gammaproteobacteria bacterium]